MDNPVSTKSYTQPTQLFQQSTEQVLTAYVLIQLSAAAGIKVFGQPAVDAILKEFCQLHNKGVFSPKHASSLTALQKRGSLRAVSLIKEKRTGEIKGRTCADGGVQRSLFDKTETTSPTVANDSLMYSILIDAKERRDVATADVVGAYLNADMEDFTLMKLTGEAVNIMVQVNNLYQPFVTTEKGKPVLYLQLKKALYWCVKSALLWYELFANTLKDMGFELNPYDPCVANKEIEGSQCTILWYVDDNKISHINPDVVTDIIQQIEKRFGKMTVTRGHEHTFLGMNFVFNGDETVSISMKTYLQEAINESKMRITKVSASPAKKELFDTNNNLPTLPKVELEAFHSVVAKLLYVSIRACPDILLAIGYLCTRVSKPNKEDQEKLKRVLEYLKGTLDLVLTLGADDLHSLCTWVDASYTVHPDMRSHTGGMISMGTGTLICKSSKQKLNTKSSTEAELVGASDYVQNTIWSKLFLEAQGHAITSNLFEQDNISAIRLERNGRASTGKQSRHIDIRYFFMKDRIKSEGIEIVHCPTEQMLADFLTKPLLGALFRRFRDVLLGYKHTSSLSDIMYSTLDSEERVGRKYVNGSTGMKK
jgi:Reverse transcriptase (RNA-dependent DNA polymerase)